MKTLRVVLCALVILLGAHPVDANGTPATALGLRVGTDIGAPAVHWERRIRPSAAWFLALGAERMFSGAHLQLGFRKYTSPAHRGIYVQIAGTLGYGATESAAWSQVQLAISAGYAWAFGSSWTLTGEMGSGLHALAARDRFGSAAAVVHGSKTHVGFGLVWR